MVVKIIANIYKRNIFLTDLNTVIWCNFMITRYELVMMWALYTVLACFFSAYS